MTLTRSAVLAYGLPNLAISVVQLPLAIYLPAFYSQVVGLPLALVGTMLVLSRLTDVVTDPIVGLVSDRWRSRIGRRKNWILMGIPLMVASIWLLWVPMGDPDADFKGIAGPVYLLVVVSLVYLANTFIDLPYRAWGADLATGYHERSAVAGVREGFGVAGLILALLIPVVMQRVFGWSGTANAVLGVAVATAIMLPLLFIPALIFVKEPPVERAGAKPVPGWRQSAKIIRRNGPFLRLVAVSVFLLVSINMTASLSLLFVQHVIGRADRFADFVLVYYLSTILGIPVWMFLSRRIGKHRTVAAAIAWLSLWSAPIPFLAQGDFGAFLFFMVMKGSAIGALLFLTASMAADVVDLDTLRSGEQRTGLYFALWGMVMKGSTAVGVLIATTVPGLFGFDPRAASNGSAALMAVAICYSVGPALIAVLSVPALWNYPINESRQRALRDRIARRNQALGRMTVNLHGS